MVYVHTCFSSGSPKFWYIFCFGTHFASQRVPIYHIKCLSKDPGHGAPKNLPVNVSQVWHSLLLGELSTSFVAPLEEDPWKLATCFPQTSLHVPFNLADFILYLFTVINHRREHTSMQSPLSPSESSNLRQSWVSMTHLLMITQ